MSFLSTFALLPQAVYSMDMRDETISHWAVMCTALRV
jgi:hypothetical protein